MDENEIRERLLLENGEFKRIHDEHRRYEELLSSLRRKSRLSDEEKIEESDLKKRKLALKDKMYKIMADFRKSL